MNKEFWIKNTVLPFALGILASIVAITFFCLNSDAFSPVYEGSVISYYEQTADTSAVADKPFDEIQEGDCIGKLIAGEELPLVADAPYHQLGDVVSYDLGSAEFGKAGYVYMQTANNHLETLQKSITFTAEGCFEKHDYVLVETKTFDTVDALKAYAPDINKGAVIYAQEKGKIGVKSTYKALIFEEVQL